MVTFAVLSSGITSASTSAIFLSENVLKALDLEEALGAAAQPLATAITLAFLVLVALINLRGVAESVKANVVLTLIEMTGLALVIVVGFYALGRGEADLARVVLFETQGDKSFFMAVIGATALAFFSMVGFEDSVNMAEETVDPVRNFPRALIAGLSVTGVVYVLISVLAAPWCRSGSSPSPPPRCSRWSRSAHRPSPSTRSSRSSRSSQWPTPC